MDWSRTFQQFILKSLELSHFNLGVRELPLREKNSGLTNHHKFETIKYSHTSGEQNLPFFHLQQLEAVILLPPSNKKCYQQVPHIFHPCTIRKWVKISQVGALS